MEASFISVERRLHRRDLQLNPDQTLHQFQFISKLVIFICKQLKRSVSLAQCCQPHLTDLDFADFTWSGWTAALGFNSVSLCFGSLNIAK